MSEIYKEKSVYFQNLDALRFLAFFVVFINHVVATMGHKTSNALVNTIKKEYLLNGDLGVNFFFVLSGFLITFLLLKEKETNKTIKLGAFYMRRVLRIWPLYFFVLFVGLALVPMFTDGLPQKFPVLTYTHVLNKQLYIFFLGNFDYVFNGISNAVVGILWSVSVEEQFYLFWPLIILFFPRKHIAKLFVVLIIGSILFRYYGMSGRSLNLMQKYHTLSALSDLATGALLAQLASSQNFLDFFKKLSPAIIALIYIVGLGLIATRMDILHFDISHNDYLKQIQYRGKAPYPRPNQIWHSIMPVVYSMFFAFVLMEQVFSERSFFKLGKIKVFTWLGKISYGLYCYHMVAIFFVLLFFMKMGFNVLRPDKTLILMEASLSLALTILISWLSYNYFEKWFLDLKHKLSKPKSAIVGDSNLTKKELKRAARKAEKKLRKKS